MKTAGIIAEYNPFHNGHAYQIQYTRKNLGADFIVIAMSGDFVQRGTPALMSKYTRTKMALAGGADLVLELPVSVSCASAEYFASGAINLLNHLGIIDILSFGSEHASMDFFTESARILADEPDDFRSVLQSSLKCGNSFPVARSIALKHYFTKHHKDDVPLLPEDFFASPNNILGIEYCKALYRQKSRITPIAIQREGAGYHDTEITQTQYPSASGIRKLLSSEMLTSKADSPDFNAFSFSDIKAALRNRIPSSVLDIFIEALQTYGTISEEHLNLLLHYRLLTETFDSLLTYQDVTEELARRILNCRNQYQGFSQFTQCLKTRELTQTRIQRALLHILLNIHEVPREIPYARILGFRRSAAPLLKAIKTNSQISLLTKLADAPKIVDRNVLQLLEETTFASNLYESLIQEQTAKKFQHEYTKPVIIY